MDGLTGGPQEKSFLLHYNFPNYSVGETGRIMGPGRREIGHGALAERSLLPVLPPEDEFRSNQPATNNNNNSRIQVGVDYDYEAVKKQDESFFNAQQDGFGSDRPTSIIRFKF